MIVTPSTARARELVCRCVVYNFPHRFTGGRCKGAAFVWEYFWNSSREECGNCNLYLDGQCQALEGLEPLRHCEAIHEIKRYHGVKA